ncbi:hypothetical protein ACOMHN_056563 [Nucella lapillus]
MSKVPDSLKKVYPNPKSLIHDLLEPLVSSGVTAMPRVAVAPRLGGQYWRTKLQLHWPSKATVAAVHSSVAGAQENVYLLACDLLKNMGLLYQPPSGSMVPVGQDYVLKILHLLHSSACIPFSPSRPQFRFVTKLLPAIPPQSIALSTHYLGLLSPQKKMQNHLWRTDVAASWPYPFEVTSLGPTSQASQYAAALQTSIKLKALGLLSKDNCLALSRMPALSRHSRTDTCTQRFDPHFEVFSDASASGFGAYLVKKGDKPVPWLASAWSEHFPDCPRILAQQRAGVGGGSSVYLESTFCELYSVVTACFTWKHKFVGKRVLVWTDNQAIVQMLNWGLHREDKMRRWGKLFSILATTCEKYSIELRAGHVHRSNNTAADLLSRCKLSAFKKEVPEAAVSQKKTKKLLFWNPLQPTNCDSNFHLKFL